MKKVEKVLFRKIKILRDELKQGRYYFNTLQLASTRRIASQNGQQQISNYRFFPKKIKSNFSTFRLFSKQSEIFWISKTCQKILSVTQICDNEKWRTELKSFSDEEYSIKKILKQDQQDLYSANDRLRLYFEFKKKLLEERQLSEATIIITQRILNQYIKLRNLVTNNSLDIDVIRSNSLIGLTKPLFNNIMKDCEKYNCLIKEGDETTLTENVEKYFIRMEKNVYLFFENMRKKQQSLQKYVDRDSMIPADNEEGQISELTSNCVSSDSEIDSRQEGKEQKESSVYQNSSLQSEQNEKPPSKFEFFKLQVEFCWQSGNYLQKFLPLN